MYYTYMVRVEGGALYTGIAKNMFSRMGEHCGQGKRSAKFTRSRKVVSLEALWSSVDRSSASRLEFALKTLKKSEKEALLSDPRLLTALLPKIEKEDYIYHSLASLELFLKKVSLKHLLSGKGA
jgi:putative endonuclease